MGLIRSHGRSASRDPKQVTTFFEVANAGFPLAHGGHPNGGVRKRTIELVVAEQLSAKCSLAVRFALASAHIQQTSLVRGARAIRPLIYFSTYENEGTN